MTLPRLANPASAVVAAPPPLCRRALARRARRAALVSAAVVALASYVSVGHATGSWMHDDMAMHGLGVCLIAFTVSALARHRPELPSLAFAVAETPLLVLVLVPAERDARPARARASPIWLQRFRN